MKESIGGYFQLELRNGSEFHRDCLKLNTGRNCLEYILSTKKFKKIYAPYYTCDAVNETLKRAHIETERYHIDDNLDPLLDKDIKKNEILLYTNYFGIKDMAVKSITKKYGKIIADNAQSFYSKPVKNNYTFYSARKFFGVPDGAYLFGLPGNSFSGNAEVSYSRFSHLTKRIDLSAEEGFGDYQRNESKLKNAAVSGMSKLTGALLRSIDYRKAAKKRKDNFAFLHKYLKDTNGLSDAISAGRFFTPMIYPYLISGGAKLREQLRKNGIYTAVYWSGMHLNTKNRFEKYLYENLVALPMDQRYNNLDMDNILKRIL
jgi:hypothetical protein